MIAAVKRWFWKCGETYNLVEENLSSTYVTWITIGNAKVGTVEGVEQAFTKCTYFTPSLYSGLLQAWLSYSNYSPEKRSTTCTHHMAAPWFAKTTLSSWQLQYNIPMSSGRASMQFSEAWRSERRVRRDRCSGKCSSLFLVTSITARLSSLLEDWRRGDWGH